MSLSIVMYNYLCFAVAWAWVGYASDLERGARGCVTWWLPWESPTANRISNTRKRELHTNVKWRTSVSSVILKQIHPDKQGCMSSSILLLDAKKYTMRCHAAVAFTNERNDKGLCTSLDLIKCVIKLCAQVTCFLTPAQQTIPVYKSSTILFIETLLY